MHWQDFVFTAGSFILCLTMIPMLRAAVPPPWRSSVPIALILYVFTLTYLSLGFVIAPVVEGIQATAWAWLAFRDLSHK